MPAPPNASQTLRSQAFDDACFDELGTIADFQTSLATEFIPRGGESLGLPRLALVSGPQGHAELEMAERIGAGGMADVFAARQAALGRTVAVKRLKAGQEERDAAVQLVAEGRLTGSLEHPNIVPIYDLGGDDAGSPLLVMKRIEGRSWLDIVDAKAPPPDWAPSDPMEWHIEILLKVCDALGFAHSRGILHRDIKPSNVMIGAFGEVYLLDWGIACDLNHIPKDEEKALVGSPGYMCPEMLTGMVRDLVPATDVYLLGATLHRCITASTRHRGETPEEIWKSIYASEPFEYDASVTPELASVLHKAMNRYRERRYQSVGEFRKALAQILKHRGSVLLTRATQQRLGAVEAKLRAGQNFKATGLARSLGECEFGFRQALEEWPGNEPATQGLQRTLELSLDEELRQGDVEGARRLLDSMPIPSQKARQRVEALAQSRARENKEVRRLKQMAQELDLEGQRPWRVAFAVGGLIIAVLGPLLLAVAVKKDIVVLNHRTSIATALAMLLPFWGLIAVIRTKVFSNVANRALTNTALAGSIFLLVSRVWGALAGLTALETMARDSFVFAILVATLAIAADPRLWLPVPAFLATAFLATWRMDLAVEISALGNLVAFSLIAVRWKLQARDSGRISD